VKKVDVPLSKDSRWLTIVSKEEQDGPEVLLEPSPNHFEPAKVYQKALLDAGIPYTQFQADNVQQEYERLVSLGVEFSVKPTEIGTVKIAVFMTLVETTSRLSKCFEIETLTANMHFVKAAEVLILLAHPRQQQCAQHQPSATWGF
jgi:hypothetical protein